MSRQVAVIGAGFSGLSASCFLAQQGFEVHVFEKHDIPGGRARMYVQDGFVFDMGPSWYWMPDVFERFFKTFGTSVKEQYDLRKLSPAFSIVFAHGDSMEVPDDVHGLYTLFESIERGSAAQLRKFLEDGRQKYEIVMQDFIYRPGLSWKEFADARLLRRAMQSGMFQSYARHVRKYFSDPRLIQLLEFPVLFLGGSPSDIPSMYSLMSYAGLVLGTWYPMGGMYSVVEALHQMAKMHGVEFHFNEEVRSFDVHEKRIQYINTSQESIAVDHVLAAADYAHIEQDLLSERHRMYSDDYWSTRVLAPSALIFFLGVDCKIPWLRHHTLFFDGSYEEHAKCIYHEPGLPDKPLFYVCAPSVTDPSVAPAGCENLFILVPLSTELEDSDRMRQECFARVMDRLEQYTGVPVRSHLLCQRSYAMQDFRSDYNALRGNAYGLANTLKQTAVLKPRMKSSKLKNLFFAGQLTVPGPGVPPSLISGEIAAGLIVDSAAKSNSNRHYAAASL